jgi:FKBP-type peptidyl-prolyl cis-trans isomerase FkpA
MKIRNLFFVVAAAGLGLASCNKAQFKKTPGGMPYQLFAGKGKDVAKEGSFLKVSYIYKVKDSVFFTTENGLPVYIPVSAQSQPYDVSELFNKLKVGDSIIATQLIDTFIKRTPQQVPPQYKKGDKIMTYIKVLDIFANDSLKKIDEEKTRIAFIANESAVIEKYLKEKNITATKMPSGVFVTVSNPGTGMQVDSGKYVSVKYTGTTLAGKKFDSNVDTAFHHSEPLSFVVGVGEMIKGFDDAVKLLKLGGVAKAYIPSTLGYGAQPRPGSGIKPYEHLVFEIEVIDIKNTPPPPAPQMPMQMPPAQKVDAAQPKN